MIIDFRIRPPAKGFEKLSIFGKKKAFDTYPFNSPDACAIPAVVHHSMPMFIEEMDAAGISQGVITARNTSTTLAPLGEDAEPWGAVSNDVIVAAAKEYPDRLISFAAIDPSLGVRKSVEEIERSVQVLGCRGVVIEPGFCTPPLLPDAPLLYPIYETCEKLGVPVAILQSFQGGPNIKFARPEHVQTAANDFPKLQFIIMHASYPYVLEAISAACYTPNIWLLPDLYMNVPIIPGREFYAHAIQFMHGRRMLFGSAYPYRSLAQSVQAVKDFNLSDEHFERFMYLNALELLSM